MPDKYFILDSSGFPKEVTSIASFTSSSDAGKLVALDGTGKIDSSLIPSGGGGGTVYTRRADEIDVDNIYVGDAAVGSSESSAAWRIYKAVFIGTTVTRKYADGVSTFTKVWNDRASYTYT